MKLYQTYAMMLVQVTLSKQMEQIFSIVGYALNLSLIASIAHLEELFAQLVLEIIN